MAKRIIIIVCVLVGLGVKYVLREHRRQEHAMQTALDQYAPALNSLSPDLLVDSDWSYSGPLGNLTLRFEREGKLVIASDAAKPTGRWKINGNMLAVYIPGANEPHQGIFSKSTDVLTGPSPHGLEPRLWSASRVHEPEQ